MHPLLHLTHPLRAGRLRARRMQLRRSALAEVPIAPSADPGEQTRPIADRAERALTIVGRRMRIIVDPGARVLIDLGRRARTTPTIAQARTTRITALVRTILTTVAEPTRITALVRTTPTTAGERMPITAPVRTTPTIVEPRMRPKVGLAEPIGISQQEPRQLLSRTVGVRHSVRTARSVPSRLTG